MIFYNDEFTLLSYEDDGKKVIKVPNELLIPEINTRTVFNFKEGEFVVDVENSRNTLSRWEKEQSKLTEERERSKIHDI